MRILIVRNIPSYIDLERRTYNIQEIGLASSLTRKGHRCDILLWTNRQEELLEVPVQGTDKKIKVYYKKGFSIMKNAIFLNCDGIFSQYEIIQTAEYNQIQSWILSRKYPKKTVVYHGPYYSKYNVKYNIISILADIFFLRSYIRNNTRFITKSVLASKYLTNKGIENVNVVGVGIDTDVFCCDSKRRNDFIETVKLCSGRKLLYIGKIEPRRNLLFLLEVLKRLQVEEKERVSLIVIGRGERKYTSKVFNRITELGLEKSVLYCEEIEQEQLQELYKYINAFILPTHYEIYGMVILEAMYFGKVVFTTYNGGSSTMILNDINGYIINGFDVTKWAKRISNCINDPKILKRVGENAHNTIIQRYTWDRICPMILDEYNKTIMKNDINGHH